MGTGRSHGTFYYSSKWVPLSENEKKEFESLYKITTDTNPRDRVRELQNHFGSNSIPFSSVCGYNKQTLEAMRKLKKNFVQLSFGWEIIEDRGPGYKFDTVDLQTLRKDIETHSEQLSPFVSSFAQNWPNWQKKPERYFAFSVLPGWREAFAMEAQKQHKNKNPYFYRFLEEGNPYIPNEIRTLYDKSLK